MPILRGQNRMKAWRKRNVTYVSRARGRLIRSRRFRGKTIRAGLGITTQHDRQRVYGRRRMPYRKRKRWGRFVKKVGAVSLKASGLRSVVFNKPESTTNTAPQQHGIQSYALYSQGSSTRTFMDDLDYMAGLENLAADPTSTAGNTVQLGTKIYFKSAVLDLTIRNSSFTKTGEAPDVFVENAPLEIDIYQIRVGKSGRDSVNGTFTDLTSFFNVGLTDTQVIKGTIGYEITLVKRGVTPFDAPLALSNYRIKIITKNKYFVPPGGTLTYQMRDPKNRVRTIQQLEENEGCNLPGWTKFVLIVFKVVPGFTVGTALNETTEKIDVGCTRKYSYKIDGINEPRHWHEYR